MGRRDTTVLNAASKLYQMAARISDCKFIQTPPQYLLIKSISPQIFIKYEWKHSDFTVKKPGRYYPIQVIKINVTRYIW